VSKKRRNGEDCLSAASSAAAVFWTWNRGRRKTTGHTILWVPFLLKKGDSPPGFEGRTLQKGKVLDGKGSLSFSVYAGLLLSFFD